MRGDAATAPHRIAPPMPSSFTDTLPPPSRNVQRRGLTRARVESLLRSLDRQAMDAEVGATGEQIRSEGSGAVVVAVAQPAVGMAR